MRKIITIENILSGWSISDYITGAGKFLSSVAIDPDLPANDDGNKPSGYIRPTSMVKFSGANVNAVPMFFLTNPKNNKIYTLLDNGRFISYSSTLGSETLIGTISACGGNGLAYYNNAIYIASNTEIAKYSPMDGTPTLDTNYWTSDLSMDALTDTTYPQINSVEMPNHVMHYHRDKMRLFICDVVDNKGTLHYIQTEKTTVEGDTNDESAFGVLDFDHGEYPTCMETYQTDLVVGLIEGLSTTTKQRSAKLSFWDMSSDSFSSITSVELSDPLITAIKNVNGTLYVFSGSANKGCRVSILVSGYKLQEVAYLPEVYPPLVGSVDHILNRILFGSNTTEPKISGSAFAIGSQYAGFPMGLHNVAEATVTGDNPMVTAVLYPTQTNSSIPPIILGSKSDSDYRLDKRSTTYNNSVWRSDVFVADRQFKIDKIRIPFVQAITDNMTLTIKVYKDGATNTPNADDDTLITINNTNYSDGERFVKIHPNIRCENNFFLEFSWSGTALLTVALPLSIYINLEE